ncbi:hypothetical protein ACLMAJ_28325 [Nocardia sp. KC 131]|uniref:hypothetical protein n=1 Tax=Nocardia arseniciresistens TaxID=3392119 RepID=UPI00398F777C
MSDLVRKRHLRLLEHGARQSEERGFSVDAIVEESAIADLIAAGYDVERHEDVDLAGRERQREVGRGNRYIQSATDME